MPDDDNNPNLFQQMLKALGYIATVIVVLVVVGFGLLVGFCGLFR